jgi:hypothetical protein
MLSIVFSGALIQVAQIGVTPNGDRLWGCVTQADAFAQRSGADTPARWGFAASASTTDLPCIAPLTSVDERLWSHEASWWLFDMAMLIAVGVVVAAVVRWRIRLNAQARTSARPARHRGGARTGSSVRPRPTGAVSIVDLAAHVFAAIDCWSPRPCRRTTFRRQMQSLSTATEY